ncbi:MAG: hypothetical protein IKE55_06015 [Kiritimatiellae bacterium]|nr:hypothetical protein [Kiritimatiellia bacterium]
MQQKGQATVKMTPIRIAVAMVALGTALCTFADDQVYITGAEYTIDGNVLTVTSGDGTLVAQTPSSVQHLKIAKGASLKLGIDNPFGTNHVLIVYGTLDVNGKAFSALRITNATDMTNVDRSIHGRVINTASVASAIMLKSSSSSYYWGTFEELPGKIEIVSCLDKPFNITGLAASSASLSSINMIGASQLQVLDRANFVKFVFQPPVDGTKPMRLGEISVTCKGVPVAITSATASSTASQDTPVEKLYDNRANTYWMAASTGEQTITLSTSDLAAVDGYRITPFDGTDQDTSYRPSGWDVYVQRVDLNGWFLVDSRRNYQWYSRQRTTSSTNILFSAESRPGNPFNGNTAVSLGGNTSSRFSSTEPLAFGALTGSGGISIEDGSTFAPGDLSGYTGTFTASARKAYLRGDIALSASVNAEQPVSIASAQNLAVVNGGTEPVSVLLDDARAGEHLFGKLSDGESGQLGLVKRGSGERVIETEDSSYTGATEVHGGTLTVARKRASVTARYIRITPLAVSGSDATYPWAMHEFQLLDANGNAVAWPSGAEATKPSNTQAHADSKLVDGDVTTRFLMGKYLDGTSGFPPAVIDAKEPVTFSSYKWWSSHRHAYDVTRRLPTSWKIEVSDVGTDGSWTVVAVDSYPMTQADSDDCTATTTRLGNENWQSKSSSADDLSGLPRGPFFLNGGAQSSGSVLNTLDPSLFASGTVRDTHRKLKAQYIRFTVYETYAPDADENAYGWQLTEISLMKDGERIAWPSATTASMTGSSAMSGNQANLCNNVLSYGDGSAGNSDRFFVRGMPSFVVINAHEVLEFDAYSLTSTSPKNSQNYRLPRTWDLEVSFNGTTYYKVDTMRNYEPTQDVLTKNYQELGPFPVAEKWPLLDMGAGDSLGDRSPVAIDDGATLKLATDYEKFGPLSGAGALDLVWNAVGEINACAPATFSGSVTGGGTLAVCGDSVQAFDCAALTGVKALELNGGAIAGSASFGGNDVSVAFNGGATRAALSGIGTLTVTGDVKYALPDVSGADSYSATLFAASSIPAESRALLSAGELVNAAHGWTWELVVTDTTVRVDGRRRGMTVIFK